MRPGLKFEDIQLFTRSKMFLSLYICTLLVCISHLIEQKAVSAVSALSSKQDSVKESCCFAGAKGSGLSDTPSLDCAEERS